jgi:hypothetical protein
MQEYINADRHIHWLSNGRHNDGSSLYMSGYTVDTPLSCEDVSELSHRRVRVRRSKARQKNPVPGSG